MIRGVSSLTEQRQRQRRGGLVTLARLGGQAMTQPARAGFRARFEREALAYALTQGRTLTPPQLDAAATALLRAHMAMMTEKRLAKRAERAAADQFRQHAEKTLDALSGIETLMADAQRKALGDSPRDRAAIQRVVEPVRLCIGCWLEMCPAQAFPAEATSMLCAEHQAMYVRAVSPGETFTISGDPVKELKPSETRPETRKALVLTHERSRDLNQRPRHQSL